MAGYKVLQDIEAEDKFVGPLTLKQFIFASITFVCAYLNFFFLTRHLWVLSLPFFPIMFVAGFLGFPWGRDQPTEIWLLAKLRFMLKPRRRIWDQSGIQELVTITAPKKVEQYVSNNLSQGEVKSRLKALAETIDSRGWAVKDAAISMATQPALATSGKGSDRLVSATTLPKVAQISDVADADDMLDEKNNPTAQHLSKMVADSSTTHRQQTLQRMQDIRSGHEEKKKDEAVPDYWFMNQPDASKMPAGYSMFGAQTVLPGAYDDKSPASSATTIDEKQLLDKIHQQESANSTAYGNTKVIMPLSQQKKKAGNHHQESHHHKSKKAAENKSKPAPAEDMLATPPVPPAPVTPPPDPAILNLANNDDLTVATLAREANKSRNKEQAKSAQEGTLESRGDQGEVVISLH